MSRSFSRLAYCVPASRTAFVYRRDKYMFHQANVVNTTWASTGDLAVNPVPTGNPSLLEYWYERVLAQMSKFINTAVFPIEVQYIRAV